MKYFTENNVPYKSQMKAFGADNASVMQGCNKSVATLFKEEIPDLVIIPCLCHWLALAASEVASCIPAEVNDVLT